MTHHPYIKSVTWTPARGPRDLTVEETAAIEDFAQHYGRKWKSVLTDTYWYNARLWTGPAGDKNVGSVLHALRNDPRWGHEGLAAYKLPK